MYNLYVFFTPVSDAHAISAVGVTCSRKCVRAPTLRPSCGGASAECSHVEFNRSKAICPPPPPFERAEEGASEMGWKGSTAACRTEKREERSRGGLHVARIQIARALLLLPSATATPAPVYTPSPTVHRHGGVSA